MEISSEEVKHIAALSRLEFDEKAVKEMGAHLGQVLEYFKTLDAVDLSRVPPTAHILSAVNVLRDDVAGDPMSRDELLANAPESDGEGYIVPRVVE